MKTEVQLQTLWTFLITPFLIQLILGARMSYISQFHMYIEEEPNFTNDAQRSSPKNIDDVVHEATHFN